MSWKRHLRRCWIEEGRCFCHWCGKRLNVNGNEHTNGDYMTIDHLVEQALGGTDDPANLVPACKKCNGKRSNGVFGGVAPERLADVEFRERTGRDR